MSTTILDAADAVRRSRRAQLADLASDLEATALIDRECVDSSAIHSRPTLLRRVAAQIAEQLAPGVDRILATTDDAPLATAISLHSGLPFATVVASGDIAQLIVSTRGELHPGEDVVIVSTTTLTQVQRWRSELAARQIGVVAAISVIARLGDDNRFVYRLSSDGLEPNQE